MVKIIIMIIMIIMVMTMRMITIKMIRLTFLGDPNDLCVRQVEHVHPVDRQEDVAHAVDDDDDGDVKMMMVVVLMVIMVMMMLMMMTNLSPEDMAGVPCSIADTTTGREPWIRNPNSPPTLGLNLNSLFLCFVHICL